MTHHLLFFSGDEEEPNPNPPPQGGLGQSWFVIEFQAGYDPSPSKLTGGNTPAGFYGPAFVTTDEEITVAGVVELRRTAPISAELLGTVTLARQRSVTLTGLRAPAERLLAARKDDEELLMLI